MRVHGQRSTLTAEHFLLMRIPRRFWEVTFDQIEVDLKEVVRNYLNNLDTMLDTGGGLLLWGENGRGKTSAAAFVAREVRRTGASVLMITSASLMESVMEKTEVAEGLLIDRARTVDFLLLDDLGKEHPGKSGFSDRVLENLLRVRSASHLTTFITTNMSHEGLKQRYKKSMLEVMKENTLPVRVEGKNYRDEAQEKLSKALATV
jgi:DNA replication protein DnaC